MEGLGINLPSLIAQLVNFIILVGALYVVAYKPIVAKLDERAKRIKDSMELTETVKRQAEMAEDDFKKKISEASHEGQEVIERAQKTAEEIRRKSLTDARSEADALVERARAEIRQERDQVLYELRREFADVTILAAGKVIERSLDKKAHRELIEQVLEESPSFKE